MKLIIIRHAETEYNKLGLIQGHIDTILSKKGKEQAKKLSKRLSKEEINVVYCSDLKRCRQTIGPLLKMKNFSVIYTKELRERKFGIFEGKSKKEFIAWLKENNSLGNYSIKLPKGESFPETRKRMNKFMNKIFKKEKGKSILIVTHGGAKVALLLNIFKKYDNTHYKKFSAENAALSIVNIKKDGNHEAKLINSTKHL